MIDVLKNEIWGGASPQLYGPEHRPLRKCEYIEEAQLIPVLLFIIFI